MPASVNACASLLTLFFAPSPVRNYADAKNVEHGAVRRVSPGNAGAGNHPAALAVRGLVRLLGSLGR